MPVTAHVNAATLAKLTALIRMLGSDQPGESTNARDAIDRILRENGCNWNDLPGLIGAAEATADMAADDASEAPWSDVDDTSDQEPQIAAEDLLDLIVRALREHVQLEEHEYLAVALWAMHTHAFERYAVTPRLALVSPVQGCGKTTLLDMLGGMCHCGRKFDGISAAALFRLIEAKRPSLLLDEMDTHDLNSQGTLRAILNGGYRRGGSIARAGRGNFGQHDCHAFATFAPVALATIGLQAIPLPLQARAIIIHMKRAAGERQLRRLDVTSEAALRVLGGHLTRWAQTVVINSDPELPPELKNRAADNWRPLIGVADACGGDWGQRAREAAVAMSGRHADEDLGVTLLHDIRTIFDGTGVDRHSSLDLVAALNACDDAPWSEWRGRHGNQQPRPLSQAQLAQMLSPFGIRPRSLWRGPRPRGKSAKGYHRSQFEEAWRSYCSPPSGRSASSVLRMLKR
jgi:Protein of unknown function (DUF3631)